MKHTSAISCTLIASVLLTGPAGCKSDGMTKSSHKDTGADPAAEQARLEEKLRRPPPFTSADDKYRTQVKLANAKTKLSPLRVPDYAEYAGLVAARPQENDAKVAYARALVATSDRAGRLYTDPHAAQAAAWMSDVIASKSDRGDYFLLRARCQEISGHPDAAAVRSDAAAAAKLSPKDAAVKLELAKLELAEQHYAAATSGVKSVLKHWPDNAQAHYLSGVLAQLHNDAPTANTEYTAAVKCQPDHVDALSVSAMNDWATGRHATFYAGVDHIRAVFPQHPIVSFARGVRELDTGNTAAAIADLQTAESLDPGNVVYAKVRETAIDRQLAANRVVVGNRPANTAQPTAGASDTDTAVAVVGGLALIGLFLWGISGNDSGGGGGGNSATATVDGINQSADADRDAQQQKFWADRRAEEERREREAAEQQRRDDYNRYLEDQRERQAQEMRDYRQRQGY